MKHDIFLSYSRKDSPVMRRVRDDLRDAGLSVWTDESLEPGTEAWEAEVEKAIREAHCLVVLLSPDALASEWVRNEITLADALRRRIFPMLLRGEQGESIPLRLISSQWIDARTDFDKAVGQLTTSVKNDVMRSHTAQTLRMERPVRTPHNAADSEEVAQVGRVNIPLSLGVAATLVVFALVALAVILANTTPNNLLQTATSTTETATEAGSAAIESNSPTAATPSPTENVTPITTPLSGRIAFVSDRDSDLYDIFTLNLENGSTQLLWTNPYTEAYLAWSPDGMLLTFTSWTEPDYIGDIYTLNTASTEVVNLTNGGGDDRFARWSPDGTRLVFESAQTDSVDIFVMNADGSHQQNISNAPDSWDREASWSPDGQRILFSSDRDGIMQIWSMNADGSDPVNLTPQNAHFGQAVWSPDGTRIAYVRCVTPATCNYDENAGTQDNWDIWVMNADGSNQVQLTTDTTSEVTPAWSPDGTHIAYTAYRDGNAEIYIMNADGSGQVNVSNHAAEDYGPVWRP